jgi:hypothetical protein
MIEAIEPVSGKKRKKLDWTPPPPPFVAGYLGPLPSQAVQAQIFSLIRRAETDVADSSVEASNKTLHAHWERKREKYLQDLKKKIYSPPPGANFSSREVAQIH